MDKPLKKTAVACALMMFAIAGLTTNGFSAYQPYILSVNGFSNTQGSTVLTARNIGALFSMILSGFIYKKVSARNVIALAGLFAGFSFILFSRVHSFAAYCGAGFIMGIAFGAGGMIPLAIVTARGYGNRKTQVLGVCAAMTGMSTLGIPLLIVSITERFGLPVSFFLEGIFILVITGIIFVLMKNGPAEFTKKEEEQSQEIKSPPYLPVSDSERVLFFIISVFAGAVGFAGITHLSVLCTGEGLSTQTAAAAVCVSGITLTVSKALYGSIKERMGAHGCQLFYVIILFISQIMFKWIGKNMIILYLSMIMFSAGLAFLTVGITDWAGTFAPWDKRTSMIQLSQIGYMTGALTFSSIPGILADVYGGSYYPAYIIFAILSVLAISLNLFLCIKHRNTAQDKL